MHKINSEMTTIVPCYEYATTRACNVCLALYMDDMEYQMPQTLLKCNGCRLVQYCSTAHQKADWEIHRDFCIAVKKICTTYKISNVFYINGQPKTQNEFVRSTIQVKFLLRTALRRPLTFHENEFTSFPNICAYCYNFQKQNVADCCNGVSYCSDEHKELDASNHKARCGQLQLYYCIYKVLPIPNEATPIFLKRVNDFEKTDLVDIFVRSTQRALSKNPIARPEFYFNFAALCDLSYIACVCFGLTFTDMNEYKSDTVIIYIVGATLEMEVYFKMWQTKLFFIQYPKITQLILYFIGPEANGLESRKFQFEFHGIQREVVYHSHKIQFENFKPKIYTKPTLIICFNCGFSEFPPCGLPNLQTSEQVMSANTWREGIKQMLAYYCVPIIFTSYTKMEAELDFGVLLHVVKNEMEQVGIKRLFTLPKNPYKDIRPIRNCNLEDEEEFYFRNGYIQGIISYQNL